MSENWSEFVREMFESARDEGLTTPVTIVYFHDSAPADPSKAWEVSSTAEPVTIDGAILPSKRFKFGLVSDQRLDHDGVPVEERRVLIGATGLPAAPNVKCDVRFQGSSWKAMSVTPLSAGGVDIAYILQVRH